VASLAWKTDFNVLLNVKRGFFASAKLSISEVFRSKKIFTAALNLDDLLAESELAPPGQAAWRLPLSIG